MRSLIWCAVSLSCADVPISAGASTAARLSRSLTVFVTNAGR